MPGFDIAEGALQFAGSRLGEVGEDLDSDFAVLRTQMDRLLDGGWSGGAARSFSAGWSEWLHGYHEAMTALRSMGQLLGETGLGYACADDDTLRHVRAVGAELS